MTRPICQFSSAPIFFRLLMTISTSSAITARGASYFLHMASRMASLVVSVLSWSMINAAVALLRTMPAKPPSASTITCSPSISCVTNVSFSFISQIVLSWNGVFQEKADRRNDLPSSDASSFAPNPTISIRFGRLITSTTCVGNTSDRDVGCRDDILGLELDDFHLSLCILFHVYTPPFAENLYLVPGVWHPVFVSRLLSQKMRSLSTHPLLSVYRITVAHPRLASNAVVSSLFDRSSTCRIARPSLDARSGTNVVGLIPHFYSAELFDPKKIDLCVNALSGLYLISTNIDIDELLKTR